MAVINITNQLQTVELSGDGSKWQVADGVSVVVSAGSAITNSFADNVSLRIAGSVAAWEAATVSGFQTLADGTDIVVAETGRVRGYFGLSLHGDQADVVNHGKILTTSATGIGIVGGGNGFLIENFGLIKGAQGVDLNGHGKLVNGKDGVIEGYSAVRFNTSVDSEIVNHGKLLGEGWSFVGGNGDDRLVNRGKMTGGVDMGDGQDHIDLRQGKVFGNVNGGAGNDVFFIDNSQVKVREIDGEGYDLIWTTASYALEDAYCEFEFLGAKGAKNISLTGNSGDNSIAGNKGKNLLSGQGGEDIFYSGAGNDQLMGGDGNDTFVFRKGDGHDTIGDYTFEGGEEDIIDLHFFNAFKDLADVLAVAANSADGVVLKLGKGDSLTIADATVNDLDAMNFDYAT
jgi:Ca2+-binding RTX toxin-like protein